MEILLVLITGALCVACFFVGAKVGQTATRGDDIKLPQNPIDAARERKEKRDARRESEREATKLDTILENIKNYDGTGIGQKDVPRGE